MLGKLSLRNAKRQSSDYIIYFITVIISVALMFSFNSLAVSEDIRELSSFMEGFSKAISGISVIIIFAIAWLINYTMKFMLEKRSKEFGTYQILGIEKKNIANMFTLENLIIGLLAFIIGIFIGTFLYQILTSIIMNLFNQPYKIKIEFSILAIFMTACYFFGIFLVVLLNCRRKIKKTKVYDLLYADKKNENNIIKKSKGNIIIFIISLVLFTLALVMNYKEFSDVSNMTGRNGFFAIIMLIIGIYLFYISISSFFVKRYLINKKKKYRKDNMFLYRNLTSKINTMSITMGTIAVMFTIILIGGNVALLMNSMLNNELEMGYPFEIMISSANDDFSKYREYIEENADIKDIYEYNIFTIKETQIRRALENTAFEGRYYDGTDNVMLLKDYNKLRDMLGHERVTLEDDEIIINCMKTAKTPFENYIKKNNKLKIYDKEFTIKEIKAENISQVSFNGYTYCIIVPDNMVDLLLEEDKDIKNNYDMDFGFKLVATTNETTNEKFYNDLDSMIPVKEKKVTSDYENQTIEHSIEVPMGMVQTRGERTSETKSFYAIISFLAFYVALIFVMATATLLAIQQLSDSEKYKYRYNLLRKLGMDDFNLNKIIFKQLLLYFIIPMIVPFIVSIPAVWGIGTIFTIGVTTNEIWTNMAIIYSMFILVYGIYFVATDVQFTRNIEEVGK